MFVKFKLKHNVYESLLAFFQLFIIISDERVICILFFFQFEIHGIGGYVVCVSSGMNRNNIHRTTNCITNNCFTIRTNLWCSRNCYLIWWKPLINSVILTETFSNSESTIIYHSDKWSLVDVQLLWIANTHMHSVSRKCVWNTHTYVSIHPGALCTVQTHIL